MRQPDPLTTKMAADYAAGDSLRTIGRRYGYSHTVVKERLEAAGVPRRHRGWGRRPRACAVCGRLFQPKRKNSVRCSVSCRPRGSRARRARTEMPR